MSGPAVADIAAFIAARLGEWEAHAQKDIWCAERASEGGHWEAHYGYNLSYSELWTAGESTNEAIARFTAMPPWPEGRPDGAEDQHQKDISLAARMASGAKSRGEQRLREVAALRGIVAQWQHSPPESPVLTFALHQIATIWADHPDYDEAWKP